MVECQLPKLKVAGSNPVSRSNKNKRLGDLPGLFFVNCKQFCKHKKSPRITLREFSYLWPGDNPPGLLHRGPRGHFLDVTTGETKNGVLLIEQFKTLINYKMMATWINSEWPFLII